jgi:hypothetical protein
MLVTIMSGFVVLWGGFRFFEETAMNCGNRSQKCFFRVYTDHRPQPFSLPIGMALSLVGLVLLAFALLEPLPLQGVPFLPDCRLDALSFH